MNDNEMEEIIDKVLNIKEEKQDNDLTEEQINDIEHVLEMIDRNKISSDNEEYTVSKHR